MDILVTGASGFIGSRLVPRLIESGHSVRAFGRSQLPGHFASQVKHFKGDILDEAAVLEAVRGSEIVFHLAGLVSYRRVDQKRQFDVNVTGTKNVMQASLRSGVKRVIHTSSIAGMGIPEPGSVGDETIVYNLSGLKLGYCDSKHAAELEVMRFWQQGLPSIILNPGIIFGEGDTHPHHRAIILAMSQGWLLGWPSGGVTFSDINDVVNVHVNAIRMGRPGQRYVIGSANLTYREAALTLSAIIGGRPPAFEIPGWAIECAGALSEVLCSVFGIRPRLTRQVAWLCQRLIFFSSDKAIKELGLKQTPFRETVRRTAKYYLEDHCLPNLYDGTL